MLRACARRCLVPFAMADTNDEFRLWAAGQELTPETVSVLIDNGVNSRTAIRALTSQDLPALGLKIGQMALVWRLINEQSASAAELLQPLVQPVAMRSRLSEL